MTSTSDWFADFCRCLQTGRVMVMVAPAKYRPTAAKPDISVPMFDFGYLFDVSSPIVTSGNGETLNQRAVEAIKSDQFRLPFPKCWYAYTCHAANDLSGKKLPNLLLDRTRIFQNLIYLEQDGDGDVTGLSFVTPGIEKFGGPRWLQNAFEWKFGSHLPDGDYLRGVTPLRVFPDFAIEGFLQDLAADNTVAKEGTMLLGAAASYTVRTTLDHGAAALKINARRAKSRQPALPQIIEIRVPLPLTLPAVEIEQVGSSGSGSPKSPHDRRSHLRRLPNGRIISIPALKVHGGAVKQQTYKVTT